MDKIKTISANILVIVFISLILVWGATWYRQWAQFARGEEARSSGNFIAAIAGYEAAIHMYTPGSPLIGRSAEKLWAIGEELERRRDAAGALVAYRSLRSSFYAARGLTTPGREWIARCDARIAELLKAP